MSATKNAFSVKQLWFSVAKIIDQNDNLFTTSYYSTV